MHRGYISIIELRCEMPHLLATCLQVVTYRLGEMGQAPKVLYTLKVSNPEGLQSWIHDLAVSQHYIAVVEQPLFYTLSVLLLH